VPSLIELQTVRQSRGSLTVIEKVLPFSVKRVFYIYDVPPPRAAGGTATRRPAWPSWPWPGAKSGNASWRFPGIQLESNTCSLARAP